MRVLILCDMEGIAGVNHWDQVQATRVLYDEGRTLYTEEVNAAIRGARAGGASEITVIDTHGAGGLEDACKFNSLRPDLIDPGVTLITHHPYMQYREILEEGRFDACLFIGIHAREGTPKGVLSHTISTKLFRNIYVNDRVVGEIGLMAALVGHYGVPMAMIAGDKAACLEATGLLGDKVVTVAVKEGLTRFSAKHVPPVRARQLVEEGARDAVQCAASMQPFVPERPTRIRYEIATIDRIDAEFRGRPRLVIDDDKLTVEVEGSDFVDAWFTSEY